MGQLLPSPLRLRFCVSYSFLENKAWPRFTDKWAPDHWASGQMDTRQLALGQMGTKANEHQDKWAPEQMGTQTIRHQDKWAPGQMVTGQVGPGQQMGTGTNGRPKIVRR